MKKASDRKGKISCESTYSWRRWSALDRTGEGNSRGAYKLAQTFLTVKKKKASDQTFKVIGIHVIRTITGLIKLNRIFKFP